MPIVWTGNMNHGKIKKWQNDFGERLEGLGREKLERERGRRHYSQVKERDWERDSWLGFMSAVGVTC